jgi:hypothetical protein
LKIERHVFGSHKGYTTLARSAGISPQDALQLESGVYGFGQTEDPSYAKSLKSCPAYFTRILSNSRRGLTRILEGAPDVAGRATTLMITAIISCTDWDRALQGDVFPLLNDKQLWVWDSSSEIAVVDRSYSSPNATISRKSAPKVAGLISEIERRFAPGESSAHRTFPIIISAAEFLPEEIRAVEMLIPPAIRPRFASACRSLGSQLRVNLNLLAAEASSQKANFRIDPGAPLSPYAQLLWQYGLSQGQLPISQVIAYRQFAQSHSSGNIGNEIAPPPPMPIEEERSNWQIWALAGGVALATAIIVAALLLRHPRSTPPIIYHPNPVSANPQMIAAINTAKKDDPNLANPPPAPVPASQVDSPHPKPTPAPALKLPNTTPTVPTKTNNPADVAELQMEMQRQENLAQVQHHWEEFKDLIADETITFDSEQRLKLIQIQSEVRDYNLQNWLQSSRSGSLIALPAFMRMQNTYFHLNSLLSNTASQDDAAMQSDANHLQADVNEVRRILSMNEVRRTKKDKRFVHLETAINRARQRLANHP